MVKITTLDFQIKVSHKEDFWEVIRIIINRLAKIMEINGNNKINKILSIQAKIQEDFLVAKALMGLEEATQIRIHKIKIMDTNQIINNTKKI